ncbi:MULTISPECIES: hypothetical protein [Campylobacter]|uniref:hypothetical protein n=1 Tax=Campylobacter TaxID=194 RepID=UPI00027A3610|nr:MULTISPECIES: hypothetical protein [Campylobacter]EJP76336.1 hypothetical protein HMPREF1139_0003 [Campylobacter sp. FOBRC14]
MSNALQIGGHSLVLCVRSEFLTLKKAIIRYEHNVREVKHASKIGYLRGNSRNNRYIVLSEYNNNGHMREITARDKEFNDKKYIKALLKEYHEKMKADYEAQSKTYKNGRLVKNRWRENMVGFSEVVISFGTERPKNQKEGLNQTEVNFVNAQVSFDRVLRFARSYCVKYGVKCLLISEHNDEKTKHYQLIFTNYLFKEHRNLRFDGKGNTSKFGRSMQEMGGIAFDGIALRGEIGSKAKHKNLKQMHKDEKEFNNEQEFNNKIRQLIVNEARKYIKKKESMFGKDYLRLEIEDDKAFVEDLVNLVLDQMKDNINIVTDSELKQRVNELTRQLLNKGEVIAKNNKLEQSNEELIQENEKLKEINANLNNQDNIIKDRNLQISNLSAELIQKEDENNKLKNQIKSFEADKEKIDELKQKANQSNILKSELEKVNQDLEYKEKTNQSLKQRNEELEALLSSENALKEDNDSKRLQIVKLQTSINSKDQRISKLEREVKVKDERIENLQDKLTVLENFKTKVINFISKISNLIPNFSKLLDDEPAEIKNEIQGKMYSRDGMEM